MSPSSSAYQALTVTQRLLHAWAIFSTDAFAGLVTWGCIVALVWRFDDLSWLEPWWERLLNSYSEFTVTTILTFVIHETAYFGAFIPWLIVGHIPSLARYKIQADKPNNSVTMWQCFWKLMFNHIFIQGPMMLATHTFLKLLGFRLHAPLPSLSGMLLKCLLCFVVEDFYFYWVHRLLHHKSIYKYVHKIHHVHAAPFGIAAEYAHPVETVLLGIGTILGPVLCTRHLLELWVWLVVRLCETVEDHSGYELPFMPTNFIPFWGGAVHHDFHHKEFDGNYASVFTVWDWVFGTDVAFREAQCKKKLQSKTQWSDAFEKLALVPTPSIEQFTDLKKTQ